MWASTLATYTKVGSDYTQDALYPRGARLGPL